MRTWTLLVVALLALGCRGSSSARVELEKRSQSDLPMIQTEADLDHYLDLLVGEALANGELTALQVEPARRAIRIMAPELGRETSKQKLGDFFQRTHTVTSL